MGSPEDAVVVENGEIVNDPLVADPQTEHEEPAPTEEPEEATEGEAPEKPGEIVNTEPDELPIEEQVRKLHDNYAYLARKLEKAGVKVPAPKLPEPIDDGSMPDIDDFDTIEEYEDAKREWKINKQVNEQVRAALTPDPNAEVEADRAAAKDEIKRTGPKRYSDFEEVVSNPTLPITMEIFDAARAVENPHVTPADVLYYLGKNPDEAVKLAAMPPVQVARAIVKIETNLESVLSRNKPVSTASNTKTVTKAPPPIRPTDSTVIITKDPAKMTQSEYEAWRRSGGGR